MSSYDDSPEPVFGPQAPGVFHARWVFPGDGNYLENVRIGIQGHLIDFVEVNVSPAPKDTCVDVVWPGLINSHCHLELSALEGCLPRGSVSFGEWLEAIVNQRLELIQNQGFGRSTKQGLRRLLAGGCTTVINCVSVPTALEATERAPMRIVSAWEVLGLTDDAGLAAYDTYQSILPLESPLHLRSVILNPHAPYSVGPALRAIIHGEQPTAWHLAESADEIELLESGTGSIARFLGRLGLRLPFSHPPGMHPLEVLIEEDLARTCSLGFHMNYLPRDPSWRSAFPEEFLAVHCPGTHLWFQRPNFPYQTLRENGVPVCLGTDSLATNTTLSMMETLRQARQTLPGIREERLLAMVTSIPAQSRPLVNLTESLGPLGVLQPDAAADLVILKTRSPNPPFLDAPDLLLETSYVGGRTAFSQERLPHLRED